MTSLRTIVFALVAVASLLMAGLQAIDGDAFQPEASAIGLGQATKGHGPQGTPAGRR